MAKLSNSERARLPDSAFAYIDSRGRRRLPINDESHVRNALSRFNQVAFEDDAARERARGRLLNAAKKYNIVPVGFMTGQLQSEQQKTEKLQGDLKEAQKIQKSLLPARSLEMPDFSITGVCRPCRAVGGDWYDYLPLPDGRMAVVLADVAGKGMGAALLMSSTRSILRLVAQDGRPPGRVLTEVNRVLLADLPAARFVTMIYAILDPARRTLTFANAGHLPPILADAGGVRPIEVEPELALGMAEESYSEHMIELQERGRLFLYSDGVVEARNKSSEEYGEARLLEYAGSTSATTEGLLKQVLNFARGRPGRDDITIVMIEALFQSR